MFVLLLHRYGNMANGNDRNHNVSRIINDSTQSTQYSILLERKNRLSFD